ncbi:unnamed protein product [Moneuplotes crassus]|uniref:Uncharacterized protein n=1 Tax=Euplotes crassus TaxID=5936 RepID=A0AAD2CZ21_EUPCR|nr:unnamed protein product [Moneuplotes crassus]
MPEVTDLHIKQDKVRTMKGEKSTLNIGSFSIITMNNPRINFSNFQKKGPMRRSYLEGGRNHLRSQKSHKSTTNMLEKFRHYKLKSKNTESMPELPPTDQNSTSELKRQRMQHDVYTSKFTRIKKKELPRCTCKADKRGCKLKLNINNLCNYCKTNEPKELSNAFHSLPSPENMDYFKRIKGSYDFSKLVSRENKVEQSKFGKKNFHFALGKTDKKIKYVPGVGVPMLSKFDINKYKNQKNDIEAFRSKLKRLVHKTRVG